MTTTLKNPNTETVTRPRSIERVIAGQPTSDGAGVKLTRVLTQQLRAGSSSSRCVRHRRPAGPSAGSGSSASRLQTVTYMIAACAS
jgi:hypothetical protein